jgi:succinyl-diaminopimelate desuccinylase
MMNNAKIFKILDRFLKFKTYDWNENRQDYYGLCALLEEMFCELGFHTEILETNSGPIFFAQMTKNNNEKHIHFNGHYDVIPPNACQQINTDNTNTKFFGRGASDMKGGILSIILALQNATKHKDCSFTSISLSPDEEVGGQVGSIEAINKLKSLDIEPNVIVIADSSYPNIVVGHRGAIWMNVVSELSIKNRFANQGRGSSSFIFAAMIAAEFEEKLREFGYDCYSAGECTTNCYAPNGILTFFSYSLDVRFDYPEKSTFVENRIKEIFHHLTTKYNIKDKLRIEKSLSVEACPPQNISQHLLTLIKKEISDVEQISAKGFYDLRIFRDIFDCDILVLGPGLPELAHSINEHIYIENIIKCSEIYQSIIRNF